MFHIADTVLNNIRLEKVYLYLFKHRNQECFSNIAVIVSYWRICNYKKIHAIIINFQYKNNFDLAFLMQC